MAERPEDLNLPTAVVSRIVKDALPDGVNVSKEARAAIAKAASVFVLYATSCANNFALKSKRKTLTGQDVLAAVEDMEFNKFVEPLKQNLVAFRKSQQGKKEASDQRRKNTTNPGAAQNRSTTEDETDTSKESKGSGSEEEDEEEEAGGESGDSDDE